MSAFDRLASKIAAQKGMSKGGADAIAAQAGRAKYGNAVMAKAAAKGVSAASVKKHSY